MCGLASYAARVTAGHCRPDSSAMSGLRGALPSDGIRSNSALVSSLLRPSGVALPLFRFASVVAWCEHPGGRPQLLRARPGYAVRLTNSPPEGGYARSD